MEELFFHLPRDLAFTYTSLLTCKSMWCRIAWIRMIPSCWIKKDRLRVIVWMPPTDTLPLSLSFAHALSVPLTSTLPFYSSARLRRRCAFSFIRVPCYLRSSEWTAEQQVDLTIYLFYLWRKRKQMRRNRRRKCHVWLHPCTDLWSRCDGDQSSQESQSLQMGLSRVCAGNVQWVGMIQSYSGITVTILEKLNGNSINKGSSNNSSVWNTWQRCDEHNREEMNQKLQIPVRDQKHRD